MRKSFWGLICLLTALVASAASYRHFVLLPQMRAPVLSQFKDPDSALFRNDILVGPWTPDRMVYCGEVNARNAVGGYVGYTYFDSDIDSASIETQSDREMYDKAGIARCDYSSDPAVKWWWLRW